MKENYDYKESLNNIKANLFDIYEDQERIVGLISNDNDRNKQVEDYIKVKDLALKLVNNISDLYERKSKTVIDEQSSNLNNASEQVRDVSASKEYDNEKAEDVTDNLLKEVDNDYSKKEISTDVDEVNEDDEEESNSVSEDEPLIKMKNIDNTNDEVEKYYLDCDKKKLNFAYVPVELFDIIKNHTNELDEEADDSDKETDDEDSFNEEIEFSNDNSNDIDMEVSDDTAQDAESDEIDESIDINKLYKKDAENAKGIIVRGDQYMKLALSKHRQEGVLEEAKAYRIDTVKRIQREKQKEELKKAEVHIDI